MKTDETRTFERHLSAAEAAVAVARNSGDKRSLAEALRALGNIQRRPPWLRDEANRTYTEAAEIYQTLDLPLYAAWVTRHIGINHEYADRLTDAELAYDEALRLYRENAQNDDLDYANAVRYVAVIKDRLGKRVEAETLWAEAVDRYEKVGVVEGVAEGTAQLALLALNKGDIGLAHDWLARAERASALSSDSDTHKFIEQAKQQFLE